MVRSFEPVGPRLPAGSVLRHYEIIRPLGSGGMGAVLLARDTRLGRLCAVKVMTARSRLRTDRFLIEARATAQLAHENVVVIYDVGEHEGAPYMVLEYLRGKTLQQILQERRDQGRPGALDETAGKTADRTADGAAGAAGDTTADTAPSGEEALSPGAHKPRQGVVGLPPQRAVELMLPVVRALAFAHERGVVHRDLKPANVMVTDTGVVKVLDFGIAKLLGAPDGPDDAALTAPDDESALTRTGAVLGTQMYMSPEQWRAEAVDHRADLWAAGVMLAELVLGHHPLTPLTRAALATIEQLDVPMPSLRELRPDLGQLPSIIDRCLRKRAEDRTASAHDLCAELEALLPAGQGVSSGDAKSNPFVGLAAFQESDAGRFFGRGGAVAEVTAQLAEQPLLVIVGPSGAGKSSFVRAGVIPALGRGGDAWEAFTLRPGTQPMIALAEMLLAEAFRASGRAVAAGRGEAAKGKAREGSAVGLPSPGDGAHAEEREELAARLRAEPGLFGAHLRALARRRLRRVLVFVDQAEELYTLAPEADRAAFFACLGGVADDAGSPLRAVLAIRSDFLDRLAEDRAALGAPGRGILLLPPMHREGLREALVRPLAAVEHRFEPPELVEEMLDALEHTRAALPLLSFTAARLWDRRDRARRVLTEESYRRMGGIGGALAAHADAVLGAMSAEERRLARAALLRLVTPERTRALCTLSELRGLSAEPGAMDGVLARLIDARLLAVDGGEAEATVELVHESLITGWPALVGWLSETQEDAVFRARLRNAAREWEAGGRSEDLLWRGRAAEVARQWRQRYSEELAPGEERYVQAVLDLADRARRRGRRLAAAVMAALAVVAALVAVLAVRAGRAAERAESLAASEAKEKESAQSEALHARNATRLAVARELRSDPTTALALLREVEQDVPAGWADLTRSVLYAGVAQVVFTHADSVASAAWSPDGKRILTASDDGMARVWNADGTGDPFVFHCNNKPITAAAWSPDGSRIVTASHDNIVRIWSVDGTNHVVVFQGHEAHPTSAAWSPDGSHIVTTSHDKTARVWNADGTGEPVVLRGHASAVFSAAWSPDGKRIATASFDNTARVWSANGTGEPIVLRGHESLLFRVAWSPDGKHILTASEDTTARVWNADGTGEPVVLRGHASAIFSAAWSPDGKRIVTAGMESDNTARIWNADGTGEPIVLRGHEDALWYAAWSPDGKRIATSSWDKTARIWNANGVGEPIILRRHDDTVWSAEWSPDGQHLLTASDDRTARIWSTGARSDALILRGHGRSAPMAAWSPDGKRILAASPDTTVRAWNADETGPPVVLHGHQGEIWSAAWSPDGKRILTASADETARIWNANGTGSPLVFRGHQGEIWSAAWSPDGKRILTASADKTARVWNADGSGQHLILRGHEDKVRSAAWSPDGRRIVTTSLDKTVRVWNADGRGDPLILGSHECVPRSAAWSPDGSHILFTCKPGMVEVWNTNGAGDPLVLHCGDPGLTSVTWSPDDMHILASSYNKTICVWNAHGPDEPLVLRGHEHVVQWASWSPDGKRIVSSSRDGTVRIWNTDGTGEPLILHGDALFLQVTFSPDGRRIAAASDDGTVWIWSDLEPVRDTSDPRLWTATTYCMPVERRMQLLNIPEPLARAHQQACLDRVAEALRAAPPQ